MRKKATWWIIVVFVSIGLLVGIGTLVNISFHNKDVGTASAQNRLRYVLVNQDQGGSFNHSQYNLGKDFVSLINQDSKNSWQVASMDIANAGFDAGNYDAVIVLGPSFSRNLLSLEAMNPQQAQISYKVRQDQNRMNNVQLKSQISDLLYTFNKRIVTMYFTSVMNNIGDAQQTVSNIVGGDNQNLDLLANTILPPLQTTPENYKSLFDATTTLTEQDKTWEAQQADFTKATTALLQEDSNKLQNNALTLSEYIQLQKSISQINAVNIQNDIRKQATTDQEAYNDQFTALNTKVAMQLQLLAGTDGSGLLNDIRSIGDQYQQQQQHGIDEVQQQVNNLRGTQENLQAQKKAIAAHYTGDENWDIDTASAAATYQAVKAQLLKQINPSKDNMPAGYFDEIDKLTQTVPVTGLRSLLTELHQKGFVTDDNWSQYQDELQVIERYANERHIDFSNQQSIVDATTSNPTMLSSTNILTIDTANPGKIEINGDDGIRLQNADDILTALQEQLKDTMTVSRDWWTGRIVLTPIPPKNDPDSDKPTESTDLGKTDTPSAQTQVKADSVPKPVKQSITVVMQWDWPAKIESTEPYTIKNYTVQYASDNSQLITSVSGNLTKYVTSLHIDQLPKLIQELTTTTSALDVASTAIAGVYGPTSGTDQTRIYWLADQISKDWLHFKKLPTLADKTSLYQRLTDLPTETLEDFLDKKLVTESINQLRTLMKNNADTAQRVTQVIGSADDTQGLSAVIRSLPTPSLILQQYQRLTDWLSTAQKTIQDQYASWRANPTMTIQNVPYRNENDRQSVYYEEDKGSALYDNFQRFAADTVQSASGVASSAAKISSLADQIATVAAQAKELQTNTDKSLAQSDMLNKTAAKQAKTNNIYNKNFNDVFKNAKTGKENRNGVFAFLANPLRLTNDDQNNSQNTLAAYMLVVITSIFAILSASFLAWLTQQTTTGQTESLLHHGLIEHNMRATGIIALGGLALAIAFTTIINQSVVQLTPYFWILLIGLLMVYILVLTYLWRQIGRLTLGLWGIFFALYLLLTPVIGVVIAQNSWLGQVYRYLPFSLLEQNFGTMLNHRMVGIGPLLIISLAAIIAILVNLLVWQKGVHSDDAEAA